jgi:hypothetical protein
MEALVMFLALVVGLMALDLASYRWGADSRDLIQDDHRR